MERSVTDASVHITQSQDPSETAGRTGLERVRLSDQGVRERHDDEQRVGVFQPAENASFD